MRNTVLLAWTLGVIFGVSGMAGLVKKHWWFLSLAAAIGLLMVVPS